MKTPELNKIRSVKERSQAIGEFLEWLRWEKGWELASRHRHAKDCYSRGEIKPPKRRNERTYGIGTYERKYTDEKWLSCDCSEGQLLPASYNIEKLLAEHFGIDLLKVENEKRALLDELRATAHTSTNSLASNISRCRRAKSRK